MYAVKEKQACINGVLFKTFERKTTGLCIEAGTTGFKGGKERRRGAEPMFRLKALAVISAFFR